jgi:hypothetical protein
MVVRATKVELNIAMFADRVGSIKRMTISFIAAPLPYTVVLRRIPCGDLIRNIGVRSFPFRLRCKRKGDYHKQCCDRRVRQNSTDGGDRMRS